MDGALPKIAKRNEQVSSGWPGGTQISPHDVEIKQKQFKKRNRLRSYHPAKIQKFFLLCTVEKFKVSEFLLDDKNATYLSS